MLSYRSNRIMTCICGHKTGDFRYFGASGAKKNSIFELSMLENIYPEVLGAKVAKNVYKFETGTKMCPLNTSLHYTF